METVKLLISIAWKLVGSWNSPVFLMSRGAIGVISTYSRLSAFPYDSFFVD